MRDLKRTVLSAAAAVLLLTGCGRTGYENYEIPEQGKSTLSPVDTIYTERHYDGIAPTKETAKQTVTAGDGACVLRCMDSYYDVTLDYSKGSPYEVGKAYAEAVLQVCEDYAAATEGYLYENVKAAFPNLDGDYTGIRNRANVFYDALPENYRLELDGFTDTVCGDSTDFCEDGLLSQEEALLIQLVPDVLRGTACSGISADGSATDSGERITCRILEWQLGSEKQICSMHSLIHMKQGSKSFTSVGYLGILTVLTAINDDGLMMAILDVGSSEGEPYSAENKHSYTYDIRYALGEFQSAREAAEFLCGNAAHYPYCVNVLCTDEKDAVIAELSVTETDGKALVRDSSTPLHDGLSWSDPAYLCVVNSFAAKGNGDMITCQAGNLIRWQRYETLFCGQTGLTLSRFKELMTSEKTDKDLIRIRSGGVVHMVIADYKTHSLQAVLTGTDGIADEPEFIDLGSWQ